MRVSIDMQHPNQELKGHHTRFRDGVRHGRLATGAITGNIDQFWAAVERSPFDRETVQQRASETVHLLPPSSTAYLTGLSSGNAVPLTDLIAYNRFRETLKPEACTVGVATGTATASGNTLVFKHSDAGLNEEFDGEGYHQNQEVNIVRYEEGTGSDENACLTVTGAGVTGVKMGVNEKGVAIGSTFARTVTYTADDQHDDSIEVSQGGSRSELMRRALLRADTVEEGVVHIMGELAVSPMDTPGTIFVADGNRAAIVEGEFTNVGVEWVDGVGARGNTFEQLDHLAVPGHEYPSTYHRHERITEILEREAGEITVDTMLDISVDHENGPSRGSICVHPDSDGEVSNVDHTADEQSATCSAAIFDLNGDNPARSTVYIALGTPCHAWRTANGKGWFAVELTDLEAGLPESFVSGDVWLEHYKPNDPVESESTPTVRR